MIPFAFGLLFGLATAFPVGVQSFVVMNQGLRFGYPRVLTGIVTASLCDTLLIVLGAAGASALLADANGRTPVLLIGIAFLAIFGVLAFRAPPEEEDEAVKSVANPFAMIAQTVGVSLFNPHAVLETVGFLGGAIVAQAAENRVEFAAGVISASWVWFLMVGLGASALQRRLTAPARLWMQRSSGAIMLTLAAVLVTRLA
ncbi:MAG: LysE family transporter [Rubrobacteraceae bacterium]|nr:LysE family transporter [Rubrobacteraceae bacterium]